MKSTDHASRTDEPTRLHKQELSGLRKDYNREVERRKREYLEEMNREDERYLDSMTVEKNGNIRFVKSSDWRDVTKTMSEMHSRNTPIISEDKLNKWFRGLDSDELSEIFPQEHDDTVGYADPETAFIKEARRSWNLLPLGEKTRIYRNISRI